MITFFYEIIMNYNTKEYEVELYYQDIGVIKQVSKIKACSMFDSVTVRR